MVVFGVLAFITLLWLRRGPSGGRTVVNLPKVAIGSGPPVVIVTVLDPKADPAWTRKIKANREEYAERHGMHTPLPSFFRGMHETNKALQAT